MIHFQKNGNKIDIIQVSTTNVANDDDPILLSVQQNNLNPILASFKIEKEQNNNYIIDVSKFYNDDSPSFNIIGERQKKEYKISGVDKSRSRIDEVKSFPKNTEIIHTLTYKVNKPPRGNSTNTFTFQINHSIIELPEDLMPVRYTDPRRLDGFLSQRNTIIAPINSNLIPTLLQNVGDLNQKTKKLIQMANLLSLSNLLFII